jgi:exodeoxyribonuclease VII small subunit
MAAKKSQPQEPAGYAEAMREVEAILAELDSNTIDVDVLSTKVERASYLISWCNERISAAQMTVDNLVADLAIEDDEDVDDDLDEDEFDDDNFDEDDDDDEDYDEDDE